MEIDKVLLLLNLNLDIIQRYTDILQKLFKFVNFIILVSSTKSVF